MKKFIRILSLIMVLALSIGVIGCDSCSDNENENENNIAEAEYTGVHQFNVTETNDYIVKDGKTDYVLVFPSKDNKYSENKIAKDEFLNFFREATGITMPSMMDTGNLTWNENSKYISIGENSLTKQAGIDVNAVDLNSRGVRIETRGKTVFLYGNREEGNINAVYDFMQLEFNYESYWVDVYDLDTGVKNLKLKNYDVTDIPDIQSVDSSLRSQLTTWSEHYSEDSRLFGYRQRRPNDAKKYAIPAFTPNGQGAMDMHNIFYLLPKEVYMDAHPSWYSTDATSVGHNENISKPNLTGQLCFTARGIAEEYQLMVKEMAEGVKRSIIAYSPSSAPYSQYIPITINDGGFVCGCSACAAMKVKYTSESTGADGCDSAAVIIFMNDVSEIVDAWLATDEGKPYDREGGLKYCFFAYGAYNDCPVKYDEDLGKYVPIDEKVALNDSVMVWLCDQQSRAENMYQNNQKSEELREYYQKWNDITDSVRMYTYSLLNYANVFDFNDFVNRYNSEYFRYLQTMNVVNLFDNDFSGNYAAASFGLLRNYLVSELSWNANQNDNELIEKFFKAMYKDGWQEMYQVFENLRLLKSSLSNNNDKNVPDTSSTYTRQFIENQLNLIEQARIKNEKYKTIDPELYEKLMLYINLEWMTPTYYVLEYYTSNYSADEVYEMKRQFKQTGNKMRFLVTRNLSSTWDELYKDYPD